MTATRRMTFDVPEDLARRIETEVADAGYASESALVVESLESHFDHSRYDGSNPEIERWLREAVLPTIERMERDGPASLTSEEVFGGVRERYLARTGGA